MLKRFATPAVATSIVATAIALHIPTAASAAPDLKALFDRLDQDRDGRLSAEEFVVRDSGTLHAALQSVDLGSMMPLMIMHHSGADRAAHGPLPHEGVSMLRTAFARQDGDGDGVVSFGEFESHHLAVLRKVFDTMDADQGGGIDQSEYGRMMSHLPSEAAAHATSFTEIDTDGDGMIAWQEFLG